MLQSTLTIVKISIVVPAFNEERLLGQSLEQIKLAARAFEQRGWETEMIVCDNNSTDKTAQIARDAGAIVVFEIAAPPLPRATGWFSWMPIRNLRPNYFPMLPTKSFPANAWPAARLSKWTRSA
jgi:glycosyltransferase involved in cell wall biosynthesis